MAGRGYGGAETRRRGDMETRRLGGEHLVSPSPHLPIPPSPRLRKVVSLAVLLCLGCGGEEGRPGPSTRTGEGLYLSEQAERNIGIEIEAAALRELAEGIRIPGTIRPRFEGRAFASSKAEGTVRRTHVRLGERVRAGQRLAEIESPEVQRLQVELMQAISSLELRVANLNRVTALRRQNIASEKEMLQARNEFSRAESEVKGLRMWLAILGLRPEEIGRVERGELMPTVAVLSPLDGTVVDRDLTLGELVERSRMLFEIVDLRTLLVEGDLNEIYVDRVASGQPVRVRVPAVPGLPLQGEVFYIGDEVDPEKRSMHLWVRVDNPDGRIKPEMFAELMVIVRTSGEVLAVPRRAVIGDAAERFVFIKDGERYLRQSVEIGMEDDRYAEIVDGLYPGDLVVVQGAQELWAESLKPKLKGH